MTCRPHPVVIGAVSVLLLASPALRAQQPSPASPPAHEHHGHQTAPSDQDEHRTSVKQLDALMRAVNSSEGAARLSAMTALLQALVNDRHACEQMMAKMKAAAHERDAAAAQPADSDAEQAHH
jgi:hypothetical protein